MIGISSVKQYVKLLVKCMLKVKNKPKGNE